MNMVITDKTALFLAQPGMNTTYNQKNPDPILQLAIDINRGMFLINGRKLNFDDDFDSFTGMNWDFETLSKIAKDFGNNPNDDLRREAFRNELIKILREELQLSEQEAIDFIDHYSQNIGYSAKNVASLFATSAATDEANLYKKDGVLLFETTRKDISSKSLDENLKAVEKKYNGEVKASLKFEDKKWSLVKLEATEECAQELEKKIPQKEKIQKLENNKYELRNYLTETLFFTCQNKTPEAFNTSVFGEDIPEIIDTFSPETIIEVQDSFKVYEHVLHEKIEQSVQKNGVKEAYRINDSKKIKPETFVNNVVSFINKIKNLSPKSQIDSSEAFLKDLKEIIKNTEWSVGFLGLGLFGGKKYSDNKNYPKHIHEILEAIDNNLTSNNPKAWDETFKKVKEISERAASSSSRFRSQKTTDSYKALKEGFQEIRKSETPRVDPEDTLEDPSQHI